MFSSALPGQGRDFLWHRICGCAALVPKGFKGNYSLKRTIMDTHEKNESGMPHTWLSVIDVIGNTPLVRLSAISPSESVVLLAKLEYMNPGGSVKDRIAVKMVEQLEHEGKLKPGGTIVESTSGNTGVGLAMVAARKGYRSVFTMPDKMSKAKQDILRAYGAEVVVTPTAVAPDDPRSYYSVAKKIAEETPRAVYINQYFHPANPLSHYQTTGPEIWDQTRGMIDAFVAGAGTGGTISGVGKYLKEQSSSVQVIAVDPEGSVYTEYFNTGTMPEARQYAIEGIGEDIIPGTIDFSVIDEFVQVSDEEAFSFCRRLAREEGILVGSSSGAACAGAVRIAEKMKQGVIVVLFPDSGVKYLDSVFSS